MSKRFFFETYLIENTLEGKIFLQNLFGNIDTFFKTNSEQIYVSREDPEQFCYFILNECIIHEKNGLRNIYRKSSQTANPSYSKNQFGRTSSTLECRQRGYVFGRAAASHS